MSKSEPVRKKRRRDGAGYSVPAAAEEIGVSYKTLRDAIEMKQVRVIEFGRITRVPKAEVARLKEVFGMNVKTPADRGRTLRLAEADRAAGVPSMHELIEDELADPLRRSLKLLEDALAQRGLYLDGAAPSPSNSRWCDVLNEQT